MKTKDLIFILIISLFWGSSFLFMRVSAPVFGPVALVMVRMVGAAFILSFIFLSAANRATLKQNWKAIAVVGLFNNVLPFVLLSFASTRLEAGFTSLINASTPVFAALIGLLWLKNRITRQQLAGLIIGVSGIYVLSMGHLSFKAGGSGWAIMAGLVATLCYGFAINLVKSRLHHVNSQVIASGSVTFSALMLLGPGLWLWPSEPIGLIHWGNALLLGFLCTGAALLMFYQLVASAGVMASASITFLIPVSAILWGYIVLHEVITFKMLIAMAITFFGTALCNRLIKWPLFKKSAATP
ncbi:DMT family transporter [Gynuella sp.]|uniref:DMT family transporter n=1 Tax=Gynuella sp. TaxID=2969146 RepID=UPI003D0DDA87